MLNWIRFLFILCTARLRSRLTLPFGVSKLNLRCGFFDADLNIANNSSFLRLMELGRIDLMVRTGLLAHLFKKKWVFALASAHVVYRRPLRRFQAFTLSTQVVCWNKDFIFVEHKMESKNKMIAYGFIKSALIERKKKRDIFEIFNEIGLNPQSPEFSPEIQRYADLDQLMREKSL